MTYYLISCTRHIEEQTFLALALLAASRQQCSEKKSKIQEYFCKLNLMQVLHQFCYHWV